jgi:quercetin dioxygenase-like cupin family protein
MVVKSLYSTTEKETGMDSPATATIDVGAISVDFLVDADDSGGSVTVFECAVPADAKVPIAHSHDAFEETIYGLEGICTWTIDGQARELGRGESVCIRRGQVHGFENRGSVGAKFLAIATPGVFGPRNSGGPRLGDTGPLDLPGFGLSRAGRTRASRSWSPAGWQA